MIRVDLGSNGLGRTRFAMSPLDVAKDLLFTLARSPRTLGATWTAQANEALATRELGLLAAIGGGGPRGYAPDFIRPEPVGFETGLDTALHQVATASPARIRYELTAAIGGHSWDRTSAGKPPRVLLAAIERGEEHIARCVADQLEQFWRAVLARHWPRIRARLEGDITTRSTVIARDGLVHAINGLDANVRWRDGGVDVTLRPGSTHRFGIDAEAVIFVPSVFVRRAVFCAGEPAGAPDPRTPLIVYPAISPPRAERPRVAELIGVTRTQLLAELAQPRTTGELAQRLHLSPATVSYHLQILHRAGLLYRTRRSHNVLYQRLPDRTPA